MKKAGTANGTGLPVEPSGDGSKDLHGVDGLVALSFVHRTGATADNLGNQADALRDKADNVADNVAAGAMNEAQGNKAVNAM